jgi:hypothetical protein
MNEKGMKGQRKRKLRREFLFSFKDVLVML